MEFNVSATNQIHTIQLEIKDSRHNKLVDKQINVSEETSKVEYIMSKIARDLAWKEICEICFTVFLDNQISYTESELKVTNLSIITLNVK